MPKMLVCVFVCLYLTGCVITTPNLSEGTETKQSDWPFFASLRITAGEVHVCGGSLVRKQWVITSASCINNYPLITLWTVDLGRYSIEGIEEGVQSFRIEKIINHPQWNQKTMDNDMALIRLNKPVNLDTKFVKLGNIVTTKEQSTQLEEGMKCAVPGWSVPQNPKLPSPTDVLRQLTVSIVKPNACKTQLPNVTSLMFCGNVSDTTKDCSLPWDKGGPLVCTMGPNTNKTRLQVGILSWGKFCNKGGTPVVYTDMAKLADWYNPILNAGESLRICLFSTLLVYLFITL